MSIEFRREKKWARFHDPRNGMELTDVESEIRYNPLTDETSRICHFSLDSLPPVDNSALIELTKTNCPFCPDSVRKVTPRYPESFLPGGRLEHGGAVLFPNMFPYDDDSAIAVLCPTHSLQADDLPVEPVIDGMTLARQFLLQIEEGFSEDSPASWPLVNWNHLPPSGGSQWHPHMQVIHTRTPTNRQRRLQVAEKAWYETHGTPWLLDLIAAEEAIGDRWIGSSSSGGVAWHAAFSPTGMLGDCMAVFPERQRYSQLEDQDIAEFADGLHKVLKGFARKGLWSFSLVFYSGPSSGDSDAHRLFAELVPRFYVNPVTHAPDVSFLQLMMQESIAMTYPEETAALLREVWD
jgi:UDPglucose--hexose-1-phosphate uridylyltransferase